MIEKSKFELLLAFDCRNKQFAVVENPGFWNWTFTLKDEDDNVLAQIDRNWRGIGFEVFILLHFQTYCSHLRGTNIYPNPLAI